MQYISNAPALKFTILFSLGILIGSKYSFYISVLIAVIVLLILITVILLNSKYKPNYFILPGLCFLIIVSGIFKSTVDFKFTPVNSIKLIPDTRQNSKIKLTGIIKEIPDYDSSRIKFILESICIASGEDTIFVSGNVLAEIKEDIFSKNKIPGNFFEAGDKISMKGRLSEPNGARNPGEFDYEKYLNIHNIYKIFYVNDLRQVQIVSKHNLNYFEQYILIPIKIFVLKTIDKSYSGDESAYLKGLITGERNDISKEMKENFVNAGVMHLIAVSGLNVAYIIISVSLILTFLRIPAIPKLIITIAFLIFYCLFTGSTASIIRASIMGTLVLISISIERKIIFYNIIGVAAMLILIYDAKQLFDPGFILSFSAVISMAVFLNVFEKILLTPIREMNIRGKKITIILLALFLTSLAAQIGTIPITCLYFSKISIVSLIANVIAVPLANLSLAIGFFQMFVAAASDYLSSVISETNVLLLYLQLSFIKWCASFEFAYFRVNDFSLLNIISYYSILALLITIKQVKEIIFRIILCFLILAAAVLYKYDFDNNLRVTFLDVGQGDCSVIQTPDDKTILVDCGRKSYVSDSGERTIAPYLRRNGISKIDLLIITHLHLDHIGGIIYLLENFKIGKIIDSGQKYNSSFIKTMDSLISIKNITRETVRSGDCIYNIENLRMYFLFPSRDFVNLSGQTLNDNLNNGSVVFILKYGETEILFSGDIEKESEKFLIDTYSGFLDTDILKVAHHGSITSSTIPFIIKNTPEYALISCGIFNKFGHPSDIVVNSLNNIGAIVYRTDLDGAVLFESDGNGIDLIDWYH